MLISKSIDRFLPYVLLALFFAVSIASRPLLPIDETRYLTVAWEMYLQGSFFVPTLNFEPYFQKPPLLFWLIDLAWSLLGVSRAAATVVIFAISSSVIYLTQRLAELLFPRVEGMADRTPWLMLGSVPFIVYSTLILFDLFLTVFVLAAFCALIAFSKGRSLRYAVLAGLLVGFGVLCKGPVMLIQIACPILFYTLWRDPQSSIAARQFFAAMPWIVLAGCIPVVAWLGPAFYEAGPEFFYNLVWHQTAGRITGSLESVHARPLYFYMLLLPLALLPWGLRPELWRSTPWQRLRRESIDDQDRRTMLFLGLWCVLVVVVLSIISGKQPHYLVPLLPPVILLFGYFMATIRFAVFPYGAALMLALFGFGQIVASVTLLPRYDLEGLAEFVAERGDAEWAYAGKYQGQLTFLARARKAFVSVEEGAADEWLQTHPGGYLILKASHYPTSTRRVVFSQLGKSGYLIVVAGAQSRASGQ